jgi:predicted RNase H-like nuclease (RuvC/YqgF family)
MEQKSNISLKVFMGISVLINIALIIFVVNLNNKNTDKETQITQLNEKIEHKDSEIKSKLEQLTNIQNDLQRIKAEREQLGLANDSLDKQMAKLNGYIAQLKKTSKLDAGKRKELEALVAQMREEIMRKDTEIAELRSQNDSLKTDVGNLTAEKQKLGDSLNNTAQELAYASILKAENIKVTVLKENGKEIEEEEYKHKLIDRIKIAFSIADNKAAKKNNKKFYVSLVPPSGKAFCDVNNGGGVCTLSDKTEVPYTLTQDLAFNNTNQKVTLTMFKGFNYVPGVYKVLVYSEGYKIGEGGFKVK